MKEMNISNVNLNSNNNTVLVTEEEGSLILHSFSDDEGGQKLKYQAQYCTRNKEPYVYIQLLDEGNELPNNEGNQKPKHRAQYRKGKKKLHKESLELLPVKENSGLPEGLLEGPPEGLPDEENLGPVKGNPRLPEGLPEGPPEGLPDEENLGPVKENPRLPEDEENLGFENFEEGSSDESDEKNHKKNEKRYYLDDKAINLGKDLHEILQFIHKLPTCPPTRDKKIFSRNELYRQAIINHLMNDSEFSFLKGFQPIDDSANNLILTDIASSNHTRVPFIANDENDIKYVLHKLVGNIFNSVAGSIKSQVAKDILRRKDLRFHVEVWKSYVCLQAFCSANLKRNKGETTRSQAKKKIMEEYPDIDFNDLDLILQISPRIYRLLQVSNGNWALLDIFEEITPTFFKSKMKIATNFDLWINLVRTGMLEDYENGQSYHERGKEELRDLKIQIIKSYFNDVDEEKLNNIVTNDD